MRRAETARGENFQSGAGNANTHQSASDKKRFPAGRAGDPAVNPKMGDFRMKRLYSGLSLTLLLCIGLTACGESEVERQKRVIAQKEASIDSLETEMGSAQTELVTLKTQLDSLTKFEMLLQAKNQQLQKEVKKYRAIAVTAQTQERRAAAGNRPVTG